MADLSAALEVVCAASDEDFKSGSVPDDTFNRALERLQRLARKEKKPPPGPDELVETLSDRLDELTQFFSQSPVNAIGKSPAVVEDYRLLDVFVSSRGASKTTQVELRRFLAQRSLAKDFNCWNPTRLESMIKKQSFDLPKNRGGSIRSFAKACFPGREQPVVEAVIIGLRALVVEKFLGSASLVLAFAYKHFKVMRLQDITTAFETHALQSVTRLVTNKSSWVVEVLTCYDAQCEPHLVTNMSILLANKRPITSGNARTNQSTCKRTKTPPRKKQKVIDGIATTSTLTVSTGATELSRGTPNPAGNPNTIHHSLELGGIGAPQMCSVQSLISRSSCEEREGRVNGVISRQPPGLGAEVSVRPGTTSRFDHGGAEGHTMQRVHHILSLTDTPRSGRKGQGGEEVGLGVISPIGEQSESTAAVWHPGPTGNPNTIRECIVNLEVNPHADRRRPITPPSEIAKPQAHPVAGESPPSMVLARSAAQVVDAEPITPIIPYPQGRQIAGKPGTIQEERQDENLLLNSPPASGINHQPFSSAGLGSQLNVQGDDDSARSPGIQSNLPSRNLGGVDVDMVHRFPEPGGAEGQQGSTVQSSEGAINGSTPGEDRNTPGTPGAVSRGSDSDGRVGGGRGSQVAELTPPSA